MVASRGGWIVRDRCYAEAGIKTTRQWDHEERRQANSTMHHCFPSARKNASSCVRQLAMQPLIHATTRREAHHEPTLDGDLELAA